MAYQLEFAEEHAVRELAARHSAVSRGPAAELRRAYDALMELGTCASTATAQVFDEYRQMYHSAFQSYNRGDLHRAELLARSTKHLCRAAWYDAKIKYLESHSEDIPHLPGLSKIGLEGLEQGVTEIENRLSRLKLTGAADRFGHRCRKHLERVCAMSDRNTVLADSFMKAAFEYCLATESLHSIEFERAAA